MEKFFEDPDSITAEELLEAIRKATISMQVVPMLCGSSFHNKGVQKLLDYVMAFLPSPLDLPAITGINPKTEQEETRNATESDPFCGLAFKIATDPFVSSMQVPTSWIRAAANASVSAVSTRCTPTSRTRWRPSAPETSAQP